MISEATKERVLNRGTEAAKYVRHVEIVDKRQPYLGLRFCARIDS